MRFRLYQGTRPSRSAVALRRAAGVRRIRREGSRFVARAGDLVLNWGSSVAPDALAAASWVNRPDAVLAASCKLASLRHFHEHGVPTVEWTTDAEQAEEWLNADGRLIGRTLLRASAGRGIVVCRAETGLVRAPLWTRYFTGFDEYRVHVWDENILDRQQKRRRRRDDEEGITRAAANDEIRNLENGWVFCREDVACPPEVDDAARRAVQALGLDFGAVDVKFKTRGRVPAVLEVNTAPGLEGTTLALYAQRVRSYL